VSAIDELLYRLAELERRLPNVLRVGTVAEADYPAARVRVRTGDILTGWLPWLTVRAGMDRSWWAPEVGEQAVILAPSGELGQGLVLFGLYRDTHPAPADRETVDRRVYADGAVIEYDREAHVLHALIPGDIVAEVSRDIRATVGRDLVASIGRDLVVSVQGRADVTAQGEARIESTTRLVRAAPVIEVDGRIVQGTGGYGGSSEFHGEIRHADGDYIQTGGDVVSEGVSLQHHVHPENDNGGPTGEPL
jgi:phage baseplate assembly protein V